MEEQIQTRRVFYDHMCASHLLNYGEPNDIQRDYLRQLAHDLVESLDIRPVYSTVDRNGTRTSLASTVEEALTEMQSPPLSLLRNFQTKSEVVP